MAEMVNHPNHYNQGSIECIDAMIEVKGIEKVKAFCECNAFKYEWRLGCKDPLVQDTNKIIWYLRKLKELWARTKTFLYPKNGHTYYFIQNIRMKNSETGEWEDAILYTDGKGTYARNAEDFYKKFTEIKG